MTKVDVLDLGYFSKETRYVYKQFIKIFSMYSKPTGSIEHHFNIIISWHRPIKISQITTKI